MTIPNEVMTRKHELSKDCWCKPSVTSYCGKDELFEQLAKIEHQRWADWQKYMHSKCYEQEICEPRASDRVMECFKTGNRIIRRELFEQWERQIATPYSELSEKEKESDRDQVRRYWDLI